MRSQKNTMLFVYVDTPVKEYPSIYVTENESLSLQLCVIFNMVQHEELHFFFADEMFVVPRLVLCANWQGKECTIVELKDVLRSCQIGQALLDARAQNLGLVNLKRK